MIQIFLKKKKIPPSSLISLIALIAFIAFFQRGSTLFIDFYDIDEMSEIIASRQLIHQNNSNAILERPLSFVFLILNIFQKFSQYDLFILHFTTILWILFNAFLLFKINTLLFNPLSGYFSALSYVIFVSAFFDYYLAVHGEVVFNPVVTLTFYFFALAETISLKSQKILFLILTSITAALALLIKGQTIAILAALFTHLLIVKPLLFKKPFYPQLQTSLLFLFTFCSSLLIIFLVYHSLDLSIHIKHYFMSNFFYALYGFSSPNSFSNTPNPILHISIKILQNILAQFPLWLALLFFFKSSTPKSKQPKILLLLFFLFSFLAIFMGSSRLYNHYFIQYLPPLCLITGYSLNRYLQNPSKKKIALVNSLIFLIIFINAFWNYQNLYYFYHHPSKIYTQNHSFISQSQKNPVAQWIKNHSLPSHNIAIWGPNIQIYWLANRKPSLRLLWTERYMFAYSITQNISPQQTIPPFKLQKLLSLLKLPPNQQWNWKTPENILYSLIVDIHQNQTFLILDTSQNSSKPFSQPLVSLPLISEYLNQYYSLVHSIQKTKIYRRIQN